MKKLIWIVVALLATSAVMASEAQMLSRLREAYGALPWAPRQTEITKLMEDYERVLSPSSYDKTVHGQVLAGQNNTGIAKYTDGILREDSDLVLRAARFYAEVLAIENSRPPTELATKLKGRATILDKAGGNSNGTYPGWVWDLAIKHAGGEPREAIRLIGLCGHDDSALRVSPSAFLDGEAKKALWQDLSGQLSQQISEREAKLEAVTDNFQLRDLEREILLARIALLGIAKESSTEILCPARESLFYYPESLGEGVDISDSLKQKIVNAQGRQSATGFDASHVPSKHYHVYGSAFLACELLRLGNPPDLVTKTGPLLAWAYRTQRMQWIIKKYREEFIPPPDRTQKDWQLEWEKYQRESIGNRELQEKLAIEYAKHLRFIFEEQSGRTPEGISEADWTSLKMKLSKGESPWSPPMSYEEVRDSLKAKHPGKEEWAYRSAYRDYLSKIKRFEAAFQTERASGDSGRIFFSPQQTILSSLYPGDPYELFTSREDYQAAKLEDWENQPAFRERYEKFQSERDAALLFENSFLGKRLLAKPNSVRGIMQLLGGYFFESTPSKGLDSDWVRRPRGWSEERFERAKRVYDSWVVDWDWTVAQHRVGAKFAQNLCSKRDKYLEDDQSSKKKTNSQSAE